VEWESEFAAFCAEEHPRLVGALSLYCGDRAVAEELAQDALSRS
jgi:RNA polymerase sigma-70 factor (ECF subfamily)